MSDKPKLNSTDAPTMGNVTKSAGDQPRALVTGGAGFIGSNLCRCLVEKRWVVRVIDDLSTGSLDNLAGVSDEIDFIEGDMADWEQTQKAVEGADYIFHQAAIPSVVLSVEDPAASNRTNVVGTLNLLTAAKDAGVKRVVYASSCAVYGDSSNSKNDEEILPKPLSPYAVTKLAGEYYCQVFQQVYGLETVCLRYFNVFGPRQRPDNPYSGVISIFIDHLIRKERPTIFGDGEQSRDFVFVSNVVEANLLAMEVPAASGQVFNIAGGGEVSVNQLFATLDRLLQANLSPIYREHRPGDIKHSRADITRARQVLGYSPRIGFEEGLRQTIEWQQGSP